MPDPMTPRRYRDPALRERLAGEYVLGTLSPRVQARLTSLMARDPDWWQWVEQWQRHLDPLLRGGDSAPPLPRQLWRRIEQGISPSPRPRRLWWPLAMAASLLLGLWLQPLLPWQSPTVIEPVRYLAMMASAQEEAPFVLVAYQGKRPGQSSIRLQQNQASPLALPADAMLWMRDKGSKALVPLAPLREVMGGRFLTPGEWQQLKASSELLVMSGEKGSERLLYRGHCIELGPWPAQS
ncbi:hypothetical protein MNZ22_10970 [Aeromonas encheleia]|uniref:hypothetical protein n=1 Tax=Aeromonas encheleia TaxID=73010 RepID=UPI001F5904CF|nr:hypothetical protein [Aeromonas encheleia]UNP87383.1 hypothetical protein MNZ22_10970 [Aeromonas encheleia]